MPSLSLTHHLSNDKISRFSSALELVHESLRVSGERPSRLKTHDGGILVIQAPGGSEPQRTYLIAQEPPVETVLPKGPSGTILAAALRETHDIPTEARPGIHDPPLPPSYRHHPQLPGFSRLGNVGDGR